MWSLMDLYALGFLFLPYRLCCSSGRGSIGFKFKLNSESDSCGILTLTSLPSESLIQWNINSYRKNRTNTKQERKKTILQPGLMLARKYKIKKKNVSYKCSVHCHLH